MALNDEEFLEVLKAGFESVHTELAKSTGAAEGRLSLLERDMDQIKVRMGPVLRVFESDLGPAAKMILLERDMKSLSEDCGNRLAALEGQRWAVIGFALSSLIITVGTLLWHIIQQNQ